MTRAEALANAIASWLALLIAVAYGLDALDVRLNPALLGILVTAGAALIWGPAIRRASGLRLETSAWLLLMLAMLAWLVWVARPAFLLPGRGPDLTHHLLLIDYIERALSLPRDLRLEGAMGEMAHYTPGVHVLAVLAGAWTGTDGFRAIYWVVSIASVLTVGFVFLIACRVLPPHPARLPIAVAATFLVVGVRAFVADAFVHDSFLAQVVSALFAVQLWWAVTAWDDDPSTLLTVTITIATLGVFLTWPVWLGPALLTLFAIAVLRRRTLWSTRLKTVVAVALPLLLFAVVHAIGRSRWLMIVRTSGAALRPSVDAIGWMLPALSTLGVAVGLALRPARSTLVLVVAIAAQAIVLYAMATSVGAETPYMALKMAYLAVYPLGVLAGVALFSIVGLMPRLRLLTPAVVSVVSSLLIGLATVRTLINTPKPSPAVSLDFYEAGRWVRANVGATCVDYLVEDPQTAYWLHLAVLGNPRTSERTAQVDRHNLRSALARWIPADGLPYAIADLSLLPAEIRSRVELVAQFGRAGVIKRPGRACH